jgi:D-beta-D-heptose 7-phosphate kinase/D-beta-D-heptose 1-phosphate adenosyltransferase
MTDRTLDDLARRLNQHTVLVVGDAMLDEYVWGDTDRVSPEAPVPVVKMRERTHRCGGAANAAVGIAALGADVSLGGIVGDDRAGSIVGEILRRQGVGDGLVPVTDRPTTTKTRIMANRQQVVRVDDEAGRPLPPHAHDSLLAWARTRLADADGLLLSDYGKGVLSPSLAAALIAAAGNSGRPVVVDPKGDDWTKYRNATIVTPNTGEALRAADRAGIKETSVEGVAAGLSEFLGGSAVLVTRGADGMLLHRPAMPALHFPVEARTVFDVTGAGDSVAAVVALGLAAGADMATAVELANVAAALVVAKVGTASVSVAEVAAALRETPVQPPAAMRLA